LLIWWVRATALPDGSPEEFKLDSVRYLVDLSSPPYPVSPVPLLRLEDGREIALSDVVCWKSADEGVASLKNGLFLVRRIPTGNR
jgi:hypothetical protein